MELSAERKAQIADIKRVCGDDLAYKWSIDNNDIGNMMIVMRAWGFEHTLEAANRQLKYSDEVTVGVTQMLYAHDSSDTELVNLSRKRELADAGLDFDSTFTYYYNVTLDVFTNKIDWIDSDDQIDRIVVPSDMTAQDIDAVFDEIYGWRFAW